MNKNLEELKKKSLIPYFFFGLFVFVVTVNVGYIIISKDSWRGVVTSYEKGIHYNDTIAQNKEQKKLGWKIEPKITKLAKQKIRLEIIVTDKAGNSVSDAKVVVNFKRPTQEGFDFFAEIDSVKKGYLSEIKFPLRGQWDFEIFVSKDDNQVRSSNRFVIQ